MGDYPVRATRQRQLRRRGLGTPGQGSDDLPTESRTWSEGRDASQRGVGGEGVRIVRRWSLPWLLDAELLAQPDYRFIELRPVLVGIVLAGGGVRSFTQIVF